MIIFTANQQPFVVGVVTDANENLPVGNPMNTFDESVGFPGGILGFRLGYQQLSCT